MTDRDLLLAQLKLVLAGGFAYCVEELETGLNTVAAPVLAHNGQVVAAISASGPSFRLTEDRIPEVAAAVRAAADEVSGRLGYLRPD